MLESDLFNLMLILALATLDDPKDYSESISDIAIIHDRPPPNINDPSPLPIVKRVAAPPVQVVCPIGFTVYSWALSQKSVVLRCVPNEQLSPPSE